MLESLAVTLRSFYLKVKMKTFITGCTTDLFQNITIYAPKCTSEIGHKHFGSREILSNHRNN